MLSLLENIIVAVIVLGAAAFLVKQFWPKPNPNRKRGGCGGNCSCSPEWLDNLKQDPPK